MFEKMFRKNEPASPEAAETTTDMIRRKEFEMESLKEYVKTLEERLKLVTTQVERDRKPAYNPHGLAADIAFKKAQIEKLDAEIQLLQTDMDPEA